MIDLITSASDTSRCLFILHVRNTISGTWDLSPVILIYVLTTRSHNAVAWSHNKSNIVRRLRSVTHELHALCRMFDVIIINDQARVALRKWLSCQHPDDGTPCILTLN